MHTPIRYHTHQMRRAARGFQPSDEILKRAILRERAILDRQIYLPQIHRHHPARADIGMTHFGVAHLPRGQADIRPVGRQQPMRAV